MNVVNGTVVASAIAEGLSDAITNTSTFSSTTLSPGPTGSAAQNATLVVVIGSAIAYGGLYTEASMADGITGFSEGKKTTKCRDGINEAWKAYDNIFHGDLLTNAIKEKIGEWWNRE